MPDNRPPDLTTTSILGLAPVTENVEETPATLSARDREAIETLSVGSAPLIVQRGPDIGARFLLDPEMTSADRSPKTDIFLDDVTVSREHCQSTASNGGYIVRGSNSLNGTYVNRERVDSIELHAGDGVQTSRYRLTYQPPTKQA